MRSKREKLPNKINNHPADDRQIKYAKSLGIDLPKEATKSDAAALISRELDEDVVASKSLIEYADENKILCSRYIGNKELHNRIFDNLEAIEKAVFFCFCVYKFYFQEENENLNRHPHSQLFKRFGKQYGQDFYVKTSIDDYIGEEIIVFGKSQSIYGGSIHTKAYKVACSYLQEALGELPKPV